jgi:hypothetical protein
MLGQAFAQNRRLELYEVNEGAEILVKGKITGFQGKYFTLEVQNAFRGDVSGSIQVEKFKNNANAKRWGKYLEGEEVLLFLNANEGHYSIVGENGEGEKLVLGNDLYLDSRGGGIKNSFGYHQVNPTLNTYAEKVELDQMVQALKDTKGLFEVATAEAKDQMGNPYIDRWSQRKAEEAAIDAFRGISSYHEQLIKMAEKYLR